MTYTELKDQVDRMAACLADMGIGKNDKVAVLLPNCISIVVAYYAILKAGGVAVMNNPIYADRELEYQFIDSESKLLICLDLLVPRMLNIKPRTKIEKSFGPRSMTTPCPVRLTAVLACRMTGSFPLQETPREI